MQGGKRDHENEASARRAALTRCGSTRMSTSDARWRTAQGRHLLSGREREKLPAILNLGPYQKDKLSVLAGIAGGEAESLHELGATVNPNGGCRAATRRCGSTDVAAAKSPGSVRAWSLAEAIDFYDAIESAAAQPWRNGKVGLSGFRYYAIRISWFVANLQLLLLAAIIPWRASRIIVMRCSMAGCSVCS